MSLFSFLFPPETRFSVNVYDQTTTVFHGEVWAVASTNEIGPFSIQAGHTNFISVINDELVLWLDKKTKKNIPIDRAVLRCFGQHVDIYLGISRLDV